MSTEFSFSRIKRINDVIAELYNPGITLHSRLMSFLGNLTSLIYYDKATILFYYKGEDGNYHKQSSISINWQNEEAKVKEYTSFYCMHDDTLPVLDTDCPIIFRCDDFFDKESREQNLYWKEYLQPTNCIHSLEGNIMLKNSDKIRCAFSLYRGKNKSDFSDRDMATMELFQIHLSSVMDDLNEDDNKSEVFFKMGNTNCVGVGVISKTGKMLRSTAKLNEMLNSPIYGVQILNMVIKMAQKMNIDGEAEGIETLERKLDDAPIFIEMTKSGNGHSSNGEDYVVMIYNLSHFISHSIEQTKEHYGLTSREFEILQELLKGKSNEDIAGSLYLSLATVKKYLANIYCKMDIKNQKQIFERLSLQ